MGKVRYFLVPLLCVARVPHLVFVHKLRCLSPHLVFVDKLTCLSFPFLVLPPYHKQQQQNSQNTFKFRCSFVVVTRVLAKSFRLFPSKQNSLPAAKLQMIGHALLSTNLWVQHPDFKKFLLPTAIWQKKKEKKSIRKNV